MAESRLQYTGGYRSFRVSPLSRESGQPAHWPAAKQGGTTKAPFRPCDAKGLFYAHVYTATELTRMLSQAGLEPVADYGQLASPPDDYPFDPFTSRLVVAQKAK